MTIVHLTDLHLRHHLPGTSIETARLSRRVPRLLRAALEQIKAEKPDLLAVSGDLLDYPLYAMDDPAMRRRGEDDLRLIAELLRGVHCPHVVIHGNHDHAGLVRSVFGHLPDDQALCGHRVLCFHDDEIDCHVPQRLLDERERFVQAIADRASLPQIHVQHYIAWPFETPGYPHAYREAEHLRDVIVRSGVVKLVLCGHYHRGVPLFSVDGTSAQQAGEGGAGRPTFFAAAPSFAEPPHRYWVYTLAEGAVTCREMQVRGRAQQRQPVVFLDRDGTISTLPAYRFGPERMELLPGAAGALRALKDAGFALVVVSNQAAVARGWVTREMVGAVNDRMAQLLWEGAGVELDGVYCAYHYPDAIFPELRAANHPDAKPNTGLLTRAAGELGLDLSRAYFIGDRLYDLGAGRNIGAKCVLVKTGHGADVAARLEPGQTDAIVDDLPAAAQWILGEYP